MRIVILVRHGTHSEVGGVLSGRSEIDLNEVGRAEADALVDTMEGVDIASMHASPRTRARQTASPLSGHLGLSVRTAAALDEVDFGTFTGRDFAMLDGDPAWVHWNVERGTARCPGGETMAEAIARAATYLAALPLADFPALCVTHCDIIRGLVAQQLGLGFDRLFAFGCDPASRTTLDITPCGPRLVALNERVRLRAPAAAVPA
jgi:broad specificity phosphatase PhoE